MIQKAETRLWKSQFSQASFFPQVAVFLGSGSELYPGMGTGIVKVLIPGIGLDEDAHVFRFFLVVSSWCLMPGRLCVGGEAHIDCRASGDVSDHSQPSSSSFSPVSSFSCQNMQSSSSSSYCKRIPHRHSTLRTLRRKLPHSRWTEKSFCFRFHSRTPRRTASPQSNRTTAGRTYRSRIDGYQSHMPRRIWSGSLLFRGSRSGILPDPGLSFSLHQLSKNHLFFCWQISNVIIL